MKALRLVGYVLVFVLVLNVVLFAFRVINWLVFWGMILLGAGFVYLVLPRFR